MVCLNEVHLMQFKSFPLQRVALSAGRILWVRWRSIINFIILPQDNTSNSYTFTTESNSQAAQKAWSSDTLRASHARFSMPLSNSKCMMLDMKGKVQTRQHTQTHTPTHKPLFMLALSARVPVCLPSSASRTCGCS